MGLGDTLGNKAEEAKGKIKEEWGDATDNTRLEAEGKAEQGGRGGLDPARYGDWEIKGLTADF